MFIMSKGSKMLLSLMYSVVILIIGLFLFKWQGNQVIDGVYVIIILVHAIRLLWTKEEVRED